MKRALLAFPALVRIGFAEALAYRAEMIVWILTTTMPLVSLALWSAVAEAGAIGRFGKRELAAYFLAALVVRQLTGCWVVWQMNMEIRSGMLSRRLLRPVHPLVAYSAENLGALPMRALVTAPFSLVALAVTGSAAVPTDPAVIGAFGLSLVAAWAIHFFVMAIIGTLAFVMESSTSVFEVWQVGFMLLSGYLVPLELFPSAVARVASVLPFRYMLAFPVELLLGLIPPGRLGPELAAQWGWVAGLFVLTLVAWRLGIRRFAAFGG